MIKLISFFSFMIFSNAFAFTTEELNAFEKKVEAIVRQQNVPKENLFYHYMLAARNLKKHQQYEHAIKYYRKALDLPVEHNENRLKGATELVFLLDQVKKYQDLKVAVAYVEDLALKLKFFKKNPNFQVVLDFYKVMGAQDLTRNVLGKEYKYFHGTTFYPQILDHEFKTRMAKGMLKEAFAMFEREDYQINGHELRAAHDLLATALKIGTKSWQCEQSLKEHRDSSAASIKICLALEQKRSNAKVNLDSLLAVLKDLDAPYLIPAVKVALR